MSILPQTVGAYTYNLRVDITAGLVHTGQRECDQPDVTGMGRCLGGSEEHARQEHRERKGREHGAKRKRVVVCKEEVSNQ